jgi:hypothetical protein
MNNLGQVSAGNFTKPFGSSSSKGMFSGTKDFLKSNSLVAKVAFLLLILVLFIIAMRFGVAAISYILSPSATPHLLKGMIDSTQQKIFPQNPSVKDAKPILRSVNRGDGLEFTWSVWIYVQNLRPDGQYKHIFHKGNPNIVLDGPESGMNFPNNAPGLYLGPNSNQITVMMNTFDQINEKFVVDDIPLNKWVNVIIRVENTTIDIYINGTIVKRHILSGVPKQNYGDVYASMNGGFNGHTSNLWYWDYSLGTSAIQDIVDQGPDMTMDDSNMKQSDPRYFSLRWFFNNSQGDNVGYGGL